MKFAFPCIPACYSRAVRNLDRIKMRHLRCLLAVAEHGSSIRAAQALSVTQPAVSKALAELEEIVGKPLFARSRKGFEINMAGRVLLRHASRSIQVLGEGVQELAEAQAKEAPPIAIGALPTAAAALLPRAVAAYRAKHPAVQIKVRTGTNVQLIGALRRGELDLVLGRLSEPSGMKGLTFEHLYSEPLVFAVKPSHPLLRRKALALADLLEWCLLLPDTGTSVREAADRFFLTAGIGLPGDYLESIDVNFCRHYALSSSAVWCTPVGVVEQDLRRGLLARLPLDTTMTGGPVGLTLRAEPIQSDELRSFVEKLREQTSATYSRQ